MGVQLDVQRHYWFFLRGVERAKDRVDGFDQVNVRFVQELGQTGVFVQSV